MNPAAMKPATVNAAGKPVPKRREGYYVIDEHRVYPSVTTILKVISKGEGLLYWAAKEAATALMEDPGLSVEEATMAFRRRRDSAGLRGSTMHSWAEALKQGADLDLTSLPTALRGYGQAFLLWRDTYRPQVLRAEYEVYSDRFKIAGTCDMKALIQGEVALVDLKTSSNLYPEFALQLEAYRVCDREMDPTQPPTALWLVQLCADGNFVAKRVTAPFKVFLAAKRLWEWQR